jgi:biotin operon repressor
MHQTSTSSIPFKQQQQQPYCAPTLAKNLAITREALWYEAARGVLES